MASFGSFETDREVYSDPIYTVYAARKSGDSKSEYAVKVFSIDRINTDPENAPELEALLVDLARTRVECIALQEKAAANSVFIAPVLETGQDERGVWYATRFYPRSVNKIISGRVALTPDAFHHIIRSIAQGALDLKRACGRSHGEIRPSIVQISKSEKLSKADVVLCDPLPGGEAEAARFEIEDLRVIGEIMLQLVRQRATASDEKFLILPILSSPEWTRIFGKTTDQWLALCNALLDPNLSPGQLTLEQLVSKLEQLRIKPRVSPVAIATLAALLVVFIGGGVFTTRHFNRGTLQITTDPPGAEIKLQVNGPFQTFGKTGAEGKPLTIKGWPKGRYPVRAEYPGLADQVSKVEVEGGKTREYKFAFAYGRVRITTDPGNASVELDGKVLGLTPYESPPLAAGQRIYFLRLTNHEPAKVSVDVTTNRQMVSAERKLIRMNVDDGLVDIFSVPGGATILEGTQALGRTPMPKSFSAGPHSITAQYEDWPTVTTNITVVAGANPAVRIRLPHGTARFDITPPDAQVFLNDKLLNLEDSTKRLQPADYTMRVTRAGYEGQSNQVTIADGVEKKIVVSLKPMLGFVEFKSDPPGAAIFDAKLTDQELGRTQPDKPLTRSFQPGTHSFIARHDDLGLDPVASQPVYVSMGTNIVLTFPFNYGSVQFVTEPAEASVLIAGKKMATPFTHRQKPGPISYRVEKEFYHPEEGTKELAAGATTSVSLRLRPVEVEVGLRSDPPGARYYLTNTPINATANGSYQLPWGDYKITARIPGPAGLPELDPQTEPADVSKDGKTAVKFAFKYATLEITNAEPDARLFYQGQPVVSLPARLYLKPDLQYDFSAGYDADDRTNLPPITLAIGRSFTPVITMPESRKNFTNSVNMVLIRVNKNLYAGQFEVTEEQYHQVMGGPLQGNRLQPAVNVKWAEALKFCESLSGAGNETQSLARQKLAGWKYALPTEAEWAGFAEPSVAVLDGSLFNRSGLQLPADIDPNRKSAGALGIYDLFGNAAEWCNGADGQPITNGGSIDNAKPKPGDDVLAKLRNPRPADAITTGSPTIGFRCVLRKPVS